MSVQLNELRLQVEKLEFDNKESVITVDILKEQNADARNELEELKRTITELKSSQKDPSAEDKEKKKQEKMALMMAQFDMARIMSSLIRSLATNNTIYFVTCSKGRSLRRTNKCVRLLLSLMRSSRTQKPHH
jgi:chromosome segregation ATPase